MSRRLVTFNSDNASVRGLARTTALLAAVADEVIEGVAGVLNAGADRIVGRLKATLPIDELESHPGALRESAHKEAGRTDLAVKVVVDAVDDKGRYIPKHVELGHQGPGGTHVPAKPAFYPTVRAEKAAIQREAQKAVREGVKRAAARAGGG